MRPMTPLITRVCPIICKGLGEGGSTCGPVKVPTKNAIAPSNVMTTSVNIRFLNHGQAGS